MYPHSVYLWQEIRKLSTQKPHAGNSTRFMAFMGFQKGFQAGLANPCALGLLGQLRIVQPFWRRLSLSQAESLVYLFQVYVPQPDVSGV